MGMKPSKLGTPTILWVQFPFKKKKKIDSGGTPDKESPSQPGFPFRDDNEEGSIVSISDEDGSDKGGASTSTCKSVPTSGRKRGLGDQTSESSTQKKPATEEGSSL